MGPDRGDLILLPFPFSDLSAQKRRPAVVVSPDHLHQVTNDRIVVAVTSNLDAHTPGGFIPLSPRDLLRGRLERPSIAVPAKVFAIHRSLVVKTLGKLKAAKIEAILDGLRMLFDSADL